MHKARLEAFSDGVFAILITIMVLELKVPEGAHPAVLIPLLPVFASYVMSYIYLGIYWNNHHHMLHVATHINGRILWANLHLLFWLSLVPFTTAWMGENAFDEWPMVLYGITLLGAAIAYVILQSAIIAEQGSDSPLRKAVERDWKGKASMVLYCLGIAGAFVHSGVAAAAYVIVAAMWIVPDRRIEKHRA